MSSSEFVPAFIVDSLPYTFAESNITIPVERVVGYVAADGASVLIDGYEPHADLKECQLFPEGEVGWRTAAYFDAYSKGRDPKLSNCLAYAQYATGATDTMDEWLWISQGRQERPVASDELATGGLHYIRSHGELRHAMVAVDANRTLSVPGLGSSRTPLLVIHNEGLRLPYGGPNAQFSEITYVQPTPVRQTFLSRLRRSKK